MKKMFFVAIFLLWTTSGIAFELHYRMEYQISGSATSRLLFFFPLRVYYDTAAIIHFKASLQADGKTIFIFENIPCSAYLMRTLGFAGKTLALLTADTHETRDMFFSESILSPWRKKAPEFAEHVKNVKHFRHLLLKHDQDGISFTRDGQGRYGNFSINLETRYVHHPSRTGIYFNVFLMMEDILGIINQRFIPGQGIQAAKEFPSSWNGDWIDFSSALNQLGGRMEKIVRSLVTVEQQFPFQMKFRVNENGPEAVEICGEAFPDVPIWKSFMVREVFRRVRVRLADGALVLDELWVGIRNNKGQGGFGRMQLALIN
ncbi:MAG: hypothetical protein JXI33_10305 [Candidatus Aminicenantes bacterium]|nr:hypothetical protein [Candidatus Aminicenantes bacterium]